MRLTVGRRILRLLLQHPLASQSNIAVPPPQNVVPVSVENGIMSAWSVLKIRKTMDA